MNTTEKLHMEFVDYKKAFDTIKNIGYQASTPKQQVV